MEILGSRALDEVFDDYIDRWHADPMQFSSGGVTPEDLAKCLAHSNFLLWHEEDKARRKDVDDSVIAAVKRSIDGLNQKRNDLIEKLDECIQALLERQVKPDEAAESNSETPGSIIDRLSILSLKIYHMNEDASRDDISPEHRERSLKRLEVLKTQRRDLLLALVRLISDLLLGSKRMKVYRQFKMYNDPELNPELYRSRSSQG